LASLRLFVALWPTQATRAACVAAQKAMCWPAGARRVAATNLHVTLAFIGAAPQEQLAHITYAADIPSAKIELTLDRIEVWKGGAAVLRPSSVPASMVDLHGRLTQSLRACGVPFDARPFAPHVTLGRNAQGILVATVPPVSWRSAGHVLALSAGGCYRVIARFA
jgi:RNA 2',3'-cyclic 3'-phosphodiesterase